MLIQLMQSIKNMSCFLSKSKVLGLQIITFFFIYQNTLVDFFMSLGPKTFILNICC